MDSALYPFSTLQNKRLHLGVCGSVAAYKAVELMRLLQKVEISVGITLTEAAMRFIAPLTFEALGASKVHTLMFGPDEDALFGHLQPGQTAQAFMVAPCSADALARFAAGLAHDMLAAQVLAFDGPVVLAPAMNPRMWQHQATQENVAQLKRRGVAFVEPGRGLVACGESGQGRLADLPELVFAAAKALVPQDFSGKTILLTLGPTHEAWDSVRVWTNRSTGLMGASLAQAAYLRGAKVHALAGPGVPRLPTEVERHDVNSAKDMFAKAKELWPQADMGIFSAAVADFSPEPFTGGKFKKADATSGLDIHFSPNPDILADLAEKRRPEQKVLAFAAETDNLREQCRDKLRRKKAHILAGNFVGTPGEGFAAATNRMFVCDHTGREEQWPVMSKADVAWRLLNWLCDL